MTKQPFIHQHLQQGFMRSFTKNVIELSNSMRGSMVDQNNILRFRHGRRWETPANTLGDKSGEMKRHSAETSVSYEDIAAGRTEKIFLNAKNVSEQMDESMTRELIRVISSATEKTGNIVDGRGKSMQETLYETIEMLELPLDKDGELSMPVMMVNPQTFEKEKANSYIDEEFDARFAALKERKKNEAIEREEARLARFERRSD